MKKLHVRNGRKSNSQNIFILKQDTRVVQPMISHLVVNFM